MSEKLPEKTSNPRLDNWEANKAAHEQKQWEDELYAEAGTSDFSDEARKRVEEAAAYEAHMAQFAGDDIDADVRYQRDVDSGETNDGIDRAIEASGVLRRMDFMARQIAELRTSEQTEEVKRMIQEKEDRLNELLEQYRQPKFDDKYLHGPNEHHQREMENVGKDAIIDRIIDHTVIGETADDSDVAENPEGVGPDDSPETGPSDDSETVETDTDSDGESSEDDGPEDDSPDGSAGGGESDSESDDEKAGDDIETVEAWSDLSDAERECVEVLAMSRREYAEITGAERESILRRVMLDKNDTLMSSVIKKLPFAQAVIDRINNDTPWAQEVEQARATYETNLRDWLKALEARLDEEAFVDEEQKRQLMTCALLAEDARLESEIVDYQHETGREGNRFTDWWVRQKGWKGNLKKAAVVFGGGLVAGAVAGSGVGLLFGAGAAATYAGLAAGAVTGAGMGVHITNRRANSFVDDDETTVAEADSAAHHERKSTTVRESAERYDEVGLDESRADFMTSDLVAENENITDEDAYRNRRRVRRMASIGMTAGGIGGGIAGNLVGNAVHNPNPTDSHNFAQRHEGGTSSGAESGTTGDTGGTTAGGEAATEAAKGAAEHTYEITHGMAPENLLREVAPDQLGQSLDGEKAYKLLMKLSDQLGNGNVFDGTRLVEHNPGNLWLPKSGITTEGLTPEAVKLAKQLIASGKI